MLFLHFCLCDLRSMYSNELADLQSPNQIKNWSIILRVIHWYDTTFVSTGLPTLDLLDYIRWYWRIIWCWTKLDNYNTLYYCKWYRVILGDTGSYRLYDTGWLLRLDYARLGSNVKNISAKNVSSKKRDNAENDPNPDPGTDPAGLNLN